MKKIGLIIGVIGVIFICMAFVFFAYLFLVPNSSLFGIQYVSGSSNEVYNLGTYTPDTLKQIDVDTSKYKITFYVSDQVSEVRAYVKHNMKGFALKKNIKKNLIHSYNVTEKSLALNTEESTGWLSGGGSYVSIYIPENMATDQLTVKLKTGSSSDINIIGVEDESQTNGYSIIGTLNTTLNKGDLTISSMEIKNINISINEGNVKIKEDLVGETNNLIIDAGKSQINFLSAGNGLEELNKENPDYGQINYFIKTLKIQSLGEKGSIKVGKTGSVESASGYRISGGTCQVYLTNRIKVESKNFDVSVGRIVYDNALGDSLFEASGNGSIYISTCESSISATSNSGNIKINNPEKAITVETNSGEIIVKNAIKTVSAVSTGSGSIDIQFVDSEELYDGENGIKNVTLRATSGNVKIINLCHLTISNGGNANIYLKYKKLVGVNMLSPELQTSSAKIKIVLPDNEPVRININSRMAVVWISIGSLIKPQMQYNEMINYDVFNETTVNVLNLASDNSVTIFGELENDIY